MKLPFRVKGDWQQVISLLRDYLDQLGFIDLYKYLVGSNAYYTNPHVVNALCQPDSFLLSSTAAGKLDGYSLVCCLMLGVIINYDDLTPLERRVADSMLEHNLLYRSEERISMGPLQLISVGGLALFIEAQSNLFRPEIPKVYLGRDSLLLMHYIDTQRIRESHQVVDLGTGSGLIGCFLSNFSHHVLATDISEESLELAVFNAMLNGVDQRINFREESCKETLLGFEHYDLLVFNPPFMLMPEGLSVPTYANGLGIGGLDYCKLFVERTADVLRRDGVAYMSAGLLGTSSGPFFVSELSRYALDLDLRIEMYIDASEKLIPGDFLQSLGLFLHRNNPQYSVRECCDKLQTLYVDKIGATDLFIVVIVIRKAIGLSPTLRVFQSRSHFINP